MHYFVCKYYCVSTKQYTISLHLQGRRPTLRGKVMQPVNLSFRRDPPVGVAGQLLLAAHHLGPHTAHRGTILVYSAPSQVCSETY